jgi:hypothetical protein
MLRRFACIRAARAACAALVASRIACTACRHALRATSRALAAARTAFSGDLKTRTAVVTQRFVLRGCWWYRLRPDLCLQPSCQYIGGSVGYVHVAYTTLQLLATAPSVVPDLTRHRWARVRRACNQIWAGGNDGNRASGLHYHDSAANTRTSLARRANSATKRACAGGAADKRRITA